MEAMAAPLVSLLLSLAVCPEPGQLCMLKSFALRYQLLVLPKCLQLPDEPCICYGVQIDSFGT